MTIHTETKDTERAAVGHAPVIAQALKVKRLLALPEVESRCRVKKSYIYARMADGTFPKCARIPGSTRVAWRESDIDAWIDAVFQMPEVGASSDSARAVTGTR